MLRKLYLSPAGYFISIILNLLAKLHRPFMVYGYFNRVKKRFGKNTRISSTVVLLDKNKLDLGDNCWIWHHSIVDASNGVKIGEGCQIGAWVGIFTHSSHISIRLLGEKYIEIDKKDRIGYQSGSVEIGEYTFIGAHSIILPNVKIGRGCIVSAGSVVSKSVPDYCLVAGNPAKVVCSVTKFDKKYFSESIVQQNYFEKTIIDDWLKSGKESPTEK